MDDDKAIAVTTCIRESWPVLLLTRLLCVCIGLL
ncbi:hypothetical protein BVRB_7g168760 [Beta vulgaris subsp. vulgaris]|nr:hypothetical protein BVRB_7g168760 [Beta vulgaris subsp. vulgaris]